MSFLNAKLFELINQPPIEDQEGKKNNLHAIARLLEHSAEYAKCEELKDLQIDFNHSKLIKLDTNTDGEHHTLLTIAVARKRLDVVKLLIKSGTELNPVLDLVNPSLTLATVPPLSTAARNNDVAMVECLLKAGAKLDNFISARASSNALVEACRFGANDAIKVLLLNGANFELEINGKKALAYIERNNVQAISLLKAATRLRDTVTELGKGESNFFAVNNTLLKAFTHNANYALAYMVKIARVTNLRGQGVEHNEKDYQPYLLRLAIKNIKTIINTFSLDSIKNSFPDGFAPLVTELNAYDVKSEHFDNAELLFKTTEEKTKTLKWFEQGTNLEATKLGMKESVLITASIICNSPVFTPITLESSSTPTEEEINDLAAKLNG